MGSIYQIPQLKSDKISRNERDMSFVHYNFNAAITGTLTEEWLVEKVFSEEEINERIQKYLLENKESLLDFL